MSERIPNEELFELIKDRKLRELRDFLVKLPAADVAEFITDLSEDDRLLIFRILPRDLATDVFENLESETQEALLSLLGTSRSAILLNEMSADDRTALLEEVPADVARRLLLLLNEEERSVALSLLGYPEFSIGRLMSPDYITVNEYWTIREVLEHIRKHGQDSDSLNVIYVLDQSHKLISDIRIRNVLLVPLDTPVRELMNENFYSLVATQDQEEAVGYFKKYGRSVLPVVDSAGVMLGIVTVDDILQVAEEEATEDVQKIGGMEALEEPYIKTSITQLVRKRANWLVILFLSEMFTASAMIYFEAQIQKAVVLALFIPLIISSGGNSGSQAATLIIRDLAIGEVTIRDWFNVFRRELISGVALGSILGTIGFLRVILWAFFFNLYGEHWFLIGVTVGISLVGIVLWGTLWGSMLPILLKRLGLDPATSSAPFVATLVDVTGIVLYFTVASFVLGGALL